MTRTELSILKILETIEGTGSFMVSGVKDFTFPGLQVKGLGEVGFPVNDLQAKALIQYAIQAPFGKGLDTITDTSVRKAWEIDANALSLQHEEWKITLKSIIKKIQKGLGIEQQKVTPSLYKLLIYEEGGFFLPHKDSEKEKGMFGTLVIGLPATHTGGELMVRFAGEEEEIDFSEAASNYRIPFAAFYADCEHEIKPVTLGYRVCLVYNLVQSGKSDSLGSPEYSHQINELTTQMQQWTFKDPTRPKVILLGHEYTPENFELENLKHHDLPRANALLAAAQKAGFYAKLALVTHYQMGGLEGGGGGYYDRYNDYEEEEEEGTMGDEIYEEYTEIEEWLESDTPSLGKININEKDIITNLEFASGDPTEQEQEGYTGNAGMTIEYWYHYGAVVCWPQKEHFTLLQQRPVQVQLNWLGYYIKHWNDANLQGEKRAKTLIESFQIDEENKNDASDYTNLIRAYVQINDIKFVQKYGLKTLPIIFDKVTIEGWNELITTYKPALFNEIFEQIGTSNDLNKINHLFKFLNTLKDSEDIDIEVFVLEQLEFLPIYLEDTKLHQLEYNGYSYNRSERKKVIESIIKTLLELSTLKVDDNDWTNQILARITAKITRTYVNTILIPIVANCKHVHTLLYKTMYEGCVADLNRRIDNKPSPPENWIRPVPENQRFSDTWKLLKSFLQSPTQRVFDYVKNESYRSQVESAINNVTIDLKTETIKKGRPYTLRITKTQTAYEKLLNEWKKDVAILKAFKK